MPVLSILNTGMKLKTVPKALALCPPFGYSNYSLTLTITNEVYHVTSSNQHKPILFSFFCSLLFKST